MPRWNTPKPTQAAVMAILIAATGAALTWLAQAPAPGRGAGEPEPPAPPAAPPPIDAPDPRPAPGDPAIAAAPPRDAASPVTVDSGLVDADPAGPAPPARTTPWRLIDARTYSLTPATIPLYARLPGAYEWPLPAIDRLELICFHRPDGPAHLGIMQTADGRLYHWGEERRFLQDTWTPTASTRARSERSPTPERSCSPCGPRPTRHANGACGARTRRTARDRPAGPDARPAAARAAKKGERGRRFGRRTIACASRPPCAEPAIRRDPPPQVPRPREGPSTAPRSGNYLYGLYLLEVNYLYVRGAFMRASERRRGAFMRAPGATAGGRLCGENPRDSQPFCGNLR